MNERYALASVLSAQARQSNRSRADLTIAALALVALLLWEVSGIDLILTRAYGGHAGFAWRDAWLTRVLLHDGGRAIAWCVFAFMVGDAMQPFAVGPSRAQRWRSIGATLVCLLLVPTIKRLTDSSCPWDLSEFGGVAAYVPHWQLGVHDGGPGHCFPSGHAVAAFAFFSAFFVWRDHRPRLATLWLAIVIVAGALFGWAQLARGAHFASHTLWSAWLCWVVCALVAPLHGMRRPPQVPISA
jgi:membrane-associated PAP2 superfamily phosphatase